MKNYTDFSLSLAKHFPSNIFLEHLLQRLSPVSTSRVDGPCWQTAYLLILIYLLTYIYLYIILFY